MYGLYQFNKHRGSRPICNPCLFIFDWKTGRAFREDLEAIIQTAEIRIEGTQFTRDLVNESPETLNPEAFVAVVEDRFKKAPVQLHVYRGQELHDRQMNGLIAGSRRSMSLP